LLVTYTPPPPGNSTPEGGLAKRNPLLLRTMADYGFV